MNIQNIKQEGISTTLILVFMAGTAGAYQISYDG